MKERINTRIERYTKERNTVLKMLKGSVDLMIDDECEILVNRIDTMNLWVVELAELTAKIKELTILLNND